MQKNILLQFTKIFHTFKFSTEQRETDVRYNIIYVTEDDSEDDSIENRNL